MTNHEKINHIACALRIDDLNVIYAEIFLALSEMDSTFDMVLDDLYNKVRIGAIGEQESYQIYRMQTFKYRDYEKLLFPWYERLFYFLCDMWEYFIGEIKK